MAHLKNVSMSARGFITPAAQGPLVRSPPRCSKLAPALPSCFGTVSGWRVINLQHWGVCPITIESNSFWLTVTLLFCHICKTFSVQGHGLECKAALLGLWRISKRLQSCGLSKSVGEWAHKCHWPSPWCSTSHLRARAVNLRKNPHWSHQLCGSTS